MWQGPRLGFIAETGRFVAMETPRVRFSCSCLCLACYFSFFIFFLVLFFFFSSASRYVYLLRVPSSVQQPPATLGKYVFFRTYSSCLCHLHPTPSRNYFVFYSFIIFFRSSYFSGGVFFVVLSYPVRQHLICLPWIFSVWFFSHCLWPHNLYLSRMKNQEGRWGYCWINDLMSLGRKNALIRRQQHPHFHSQFRRRHLQNFVYL